MPSDRIQQTQRFYKRSSETIPLPQNIQAGIFFQIGRKVSRLI